MKILATLLLCCVAPAAVPAQVTSSPAKGEKPAQAAPAKQPPQAPVRAPASPPAQKIDSAKEAAIRKLFETQGAAGLAQQIMSGMMGSMRPLLTSSLPPGEYREKLVDLFIQKFQSKVKAEQIIDLAVPIYDKYFSREEIEGLIQFYQTPLGQKTLSVLPNVMTEVQTDARKLGEKLGRESMLEVLDEHPDLKQALEEAAASSKKP